MIDKAFKPDPLIRHTQVIDRRLDYCPDCGESTCHCLEEEIYLSNYQGQSFDEFSMRQTDKTVTERLRLKMFGY